MKLDPRALVLLTIIAMAMAVIGWASPAPGSFTRAIADTLYCVVAGTNCYGTIPTGGTFCQGTGTSSEQATGPNCSDVYCTTNGQAAIYGNPQCAATINAGVSKLYLQKTTKTAFSSATFTSIVSGNAWASPPGTAYNGNLAQFIDCIATFDFDTSVGTTIGVFRITDTTNSRNSGYNIQLGPGLVLNSNETLAMLAEFSGYVPGAAPTFALQVSVSGAAGTITIGPGAMLCTRTQGDTSTASVG